MKSNCPKVINALDELGITTEVFIVDWVFTAFTRAFNLKVARVFWDIWLVFGDYYLLRIAYGVFSLIKQDLEELKNIKNGLNFIRHKTTSLKLSDLLKVALRENKNPKEFKALVEKKIVTVNNLKSLNQAI